MSSWFVSLHGTARSAVRTRQSLERYGFATPCIPDDLFDTAPGRMGAEAAAEIIQQSSNLIIRHAVGKTRHDGAAFPAYGANTRQDDIGGVARIRRAEGRAEAQIDSAIGQRPAGFVAVCAGGLIDGSAGNIGGDRPSLGRCEVDP